MILTGLPARIANSARSRFRSRRWKSFEWLKERRLNRHRAPAKGPIFVFGCQRSGTTHIENLFRADMRARVFGEFSALSISPRHTRWAGFDTMRDVLAENPGKYWVIRSLLASDLALDALDAWPEATAIWVFRDANSVVDSMLRKWQGGFRAISERVESDFEGDWALRPLWDRIEDEARELAPEAAPQDRLRDTYALFWYHRNRLVFDLDLATNPRVLLSDYLDFTAAPQANLAILRDRIGVAAPGWTYPLETRPASADTSAKPRFSPAVQAKCDALYRELRGVSARPDSGAVA